MSFDPKDHLTKMGTRDYLETKWRIAWFRDEHPNGKIATRVLQSDPPLVKATIFDNDGAFMASAHGTAKTKQGAVWAGREIEKAETAAIGRALGHAGYGTQFTDEDEGDHLSDSPVERRQAPQNGKQAQRPPQPPPAQPSPVAGGSSRPLASDGSTPSGSGNGDASNSAKAEFFPDDAVVMPLNTESDADHLPRDVNGLPVLGSLDMKALGKLAQDEGLVKGRNHFSNLIDLLYREGSIRAASKPDAVMDAIKQHYAEKDLAKEGVEAR